MVEDDYIVEEKDIYLLPYLSGYSYERVVTKENLYDYKLKTKKNGLLTEIIFDKTDEFKNIQSRVEQGIMVQPKSTQVIVIEDQEKMNFLPIEGSCRLIPKFEKEIKVSNENKNDNDENLKMMQVQFKKREGNDETQQKKKSYVYQYNSVMNEPWIEKKIIHNPIVLSRMLNHMDINGC